MKKGITPIISIIVLLLITVALAGVAWVYLSGYLGSQIEKSFSIAPNGVVCTDTGGGVNQITVMVTNTGTGPLTAADFLLTQIDGGTVATVATFPAALASKEGAVLIQDNAGGVGYTMGTHKVDIATAASTISREVMCP
jgi:flagellin-like protein